MAGAIDGVNRSPVPIETIHDFRLYTLREVDIFPPQVRAGRVPSKTRYRRRQFPTLKGRNVEQFFSTEEGAALVARAHELLKTNTLPSIAALDRRLFLGYSMAAKILVELQSRGIVSAVQADGARRYLGEGADGRRAFEALAAELNAGIEPAAHWFRKLSAVKRRAYFPGINEAAQWADLSGADMGRARSIFWRNKDKYVALRNEFDYVGVAA